MTTIVESDSSQAELLHSSLTGAAVLSSIDQVTEHLQQRPGEYAVVLGPSVDIEEAAGFAGWARIHRPSLGVILLRIRVDSSVLGEAMRSGMREVVEARDLTGVGQAVRRAHEVHAAMTQGQGGSATPAGPTGSLITVFSTKGGVGKSLVATNLGAALADQGRRVCIVDLDVHSGDVAIMLQLSPTRHLGDLAQFGAQLDHGVVESLLTPHSDRLSVLAAPLQIDSPDHATSVQVTTTLQLLKTMFDVVVVDTSGIFDDNSLAALDETDTLVLVGTLDIPALKSLKLAIGTLDLLNFSRDRWRLLLNRADPKVGLSVKEFQEALGVEAAATLASSREVLAAVNRGEPIVRAHPGNAAAKTLSSFARSLGTAPVTAAEGAQEQPAAAQHAGSGRRLRLRKVG